MGENHACHQQFSRNPQIFHVRRDFLLGLPTITSILRRISVVRSQLATSGPGLWAAFEHSNRPSLAPSIRGGIF